jgi:hypothetical protein
VLLRFVHATATKRRDVPKATCGKRVCWLRAAGVPGKVSPQPRTARWATTRLTDDERLKAIRGAFAIAPVDVADAGAQHEARWRAGEDQCFVLCAPDGPVIGWLSAPNKAWVSVAVTADAAWRMTPHAVAEGAIKLVARDAAEHEVASWEQWWRLSQHARVGNAELRLRSGPALFKRRFRLRDEHGRLASVRMDLGKPTHVDNGVVVPTPLAFAGLRIDWARRPEDTALLALMLTYVLVVRTLRMMPTFQPPIAFAG